MALTLAFAGEASAKTASVVKDTDSGQTSWMGSSDAAGTDAAAKPLQPMTKEEEEAMKKYLRELQQAITAVQGARLSDQTKTLSSQASHLRVLSTVNSLRAIPKSQDLQMVRDAQAATSVAKASPNVNILTTPAREG